VLPVGVGWVGVGFVALEGDKAGVVGSTVGVVETTVVVETVADVDGCEVAQASGTHANWNSKRSPGRRSSVRPAGTSGSNGATVGSGLCCGTRANAPLASAAVRLGIPVTVQADFTVPMTVSYVTPPVDELCVRVTDCTAEF
jgi:hypothetical protein